MNNLLSIINKSKKSIALKSNNQSLTYCDLHTYTLKLLSKLNKLGIKAGDHVGIYISNHLTFMLTYLALWELGAVIVPMDIKLSMKNCVQIATFTDLNFLITESKKINTDLIADLRSNNHLTQGIVMFDKLYDNPSYYKLNSNPSLTNLYKLSSENLILFTSGSTGQPKGVILSKNSILNNVKKVIEYTKINSNDTFLLSLPLSYSYGMSHTLAHLLIGGSIIISSSNLSSQLILSEISLHKITNYATTPYFYESLCHQIQQNTYLPKLNHLKFFMNGGGPISPNHIDTILKYFPHLFFINNYGQTEASSRLSYTIFQADDHQYEGVGQALKGVNFAILDENENSLPFNQIGEIAYRSEDMFLGYYKQSTSHLNQQGYFLSGDLGFFDSNNNLHIVGRKDSMIKLNGRKFYLKLIETKLEKINYWKHIELKKELHPLYGEYICAYVVLSKRDSHQKTIPEIKKIFKEILAPEERPKKIILCESLKVSSNGKINLSAKK